MNTPWPNFSCSNDGWLGSQAARMIGPRPPGVRLRTGLIARLPERQRSVFMLSHYEGCTSREVSALTGLNESTVRVHLFRAIRRLRTLLAPDAARESAGAAAGEKRRVNP